MRDDTWVALVHTPGPAAPTDGSLFASPGFAEARRLAAEDDRSVATGFFTVDVRPWSVVVHA